MMENINTITKIKSKKNFFEIYVNNNIYQIDAYYYECLLPYVNKKLTVSQMLQLIAFSSSLNVLKRYYKKIFNNSISSYELKTKLKEKEISEDKISIIIDFFKEQGLLKDIDFINHYKEIYQNKKGKLAFKKFLESKHINSSLINSSLLTYKENDDKALNYANNYLKGKVGSNRLLKQKVYACLVNKGYSEKTINNVMNELVFENEDINLKIQAKKYLKKYNDDINKTISKLINIGYNVNDVKKVLKKEGMSYED